MHMTLRQILAIYMLLLLAVGSSCNGESAASKKQAPDRNAVAPGSDQSASNSEAAPLKPEAVAPSTQKKHLSIDTSRNANQPVYEKDRSKNIPAPVTKTAPNKHPGVAGYVTRDLALLQTEPAAGAPKISTLKKNEIIYILQTIMTDEKGQVTEYPTWYRVERENKQTGWVLAKSVVAGGGG